MLAHKLLGVIFDLDDTLVSSSLNFDKIRKSLGCAPEIDLLDFVEALPTDQRIDANEQLLTYEINDAMNAKKMPGTEQLLALLSELCIPCAIVTRNCRQAAAIKVNSNNIDISIVLTREDHKAKPAPDALLHIAKLWQIAPENLLYVGDYLYDLQAAKNAKTMSSLVTNGKITHYAHLADIVVDDLIELSDKIQAEFMSDSAHGVS
ncbi:MAG: HAD family phosphatase [Cognaticolwellia sp.]